MTAVRALLTSLSLAFAFPAAASACTALVPQADFERLGGKLIVSHKADTDMGAVYSRFYCWRRACNGGAEFSGYVDEAGMARIQKIEKNYWTIEPSWHAAELRALLAKETYEPPMLNGHPVCVEKRWVIAFGSPEVDFHL